VAAELAVALPALGAACATVLRPRPRWALAVGAALGLGGAFALIVSVPGPVTDQVGLTFAMSAASRALLIAAAAALAFLVVLTPERADRTAILRWGLGGLAGMGAIAAAPTLDFAVLVLLALASLQAAGAARRPYAQRLRMPVLAVALLGVGLVLARLQGPPLVVRLGAVALVAGLAAAVGLLPYLHEFDPDEGTATSPIPWIAFIGPVLALVVVMRARELLPSAAAELGAMLIGLGLVNILWGGIASWRTVSGAAAWRYSLIADWGLALCGFGLAVSDGQAAAVLVLCTILVGRLPLYLWSRQALRGDEQTDRPVNLLVAAALAGSAPFAGFAARILILRSATSLYWPLALVLAVCLLLWLPGSLRLGRSLGIPRGRQLLGVVIVLAASAALGLYPQAFLALAGR
jgi:hypothetical protein